MVFSKGSETVAEVHWGKNLLCVLVMFHDHKQKLEILTWAWHSYLFYFYFKGYIHAKVEHVITHALNKVQKIKILQNPFTYGNIYDNYSEVNYILFSNLSEKYLYYKRVLIHVQNNFLKFLSHNFKTSWMLVQCLEKQVPGFC